jgi:hypothetical protein
MISDLLSSILDANTRRAVKTIPSPLVCTLRTPL